MIDHACALERRSPTPRLQLYSGPYQQPSVARLSAVTPTTFLTAQRRIATGLAFNLLGVAIDVGAVSVQPALFDAPAVLAPAPPTPPTMAPTPAPTVPTQALHG
jgi:hypothetical protein